MTTLDTKAELAWWRSRVLRVGAGLKPQRRLYAETFRIAHDDPRIDAQIDALVEAALDDKEPTVTIATELMLAITLRFRRRKKGQGPPERTSIQGVNLRRAGHEALRKQEELQRALGLDRRAYLKAERTMIDEVRKRYPFRNKDNLKDHKVYIFNASELRDEMNEQRKKRRKREAAKRSGSAPS